MSGEIERRLKEINRDLSATRLAAEAYPVFVRGEGSFKGTPIDTGRARRNTKLSGDRILAQYPYATRLNQGSSKQAPDGMSKPTDDYIKKFIENYSKKG